MLLLPQAEAYPYLVTDAAFEDTCWFTDDFSVTVDGATTWSDDVESGANGWTGDWQRTTEAAHSGATSWTDSSVRASR